MTYKIEFSQSAHKLLKKLPKKDQEKIEEKIDSLTDDPRPEGSIKLKSSKGSSFYRIRHGDYRVVYIIQDSILLILVVEIGHRKEIYRLF